MTSYKVLRLRGAKGGRLAYSSITDPELRKAALQERSRKGNEAKRLKYPPKPRQDFIPGGNWDGELSLPIPADAFSATSSDGEWESLGDEEEN